MFDQREASQQRGPRPAAVVACPLTMNSAAKAATGIMDTYAAGVLVDAIAVGTPLTLVVMVSSRAARPEWAPDRRTVRRRQTRCEGAASRRGAARAGLSPGSVRRLHALLRRSLTIAVRWQLIHTNPVMAVDPPAVAVAEVEPYSVSEARAFIAAIRGERFEVRWVLAITLGLRQGEALGLSWRDVDLDQAVLRVRQALQYRSGAGLQLVQPKTMRSRRTIPLPAFLVAALKLHRERQDHERESAGEFWEDWGLLFTTHVGTPLSPRNDYRDFRRIVDAAGLRQVRLHDLRHTAASVMLALGVAPRVVMEVLGHSQISITMNTYSHVSPVLSREAADQIEVLFGGGAAPLAAAEAANSPQNGAEDGRTEGKDRSD